MLSYEEELFYAAEEGDTLEFFNGCEVKVEGKNVSSMTLYITGRAPKFDTPFTVLYNYYPLELYRIRQYVKGIKGKQIPMSEEEETNDRSETEIAVDLLVDALEQISKIINDTIKEINKNVEKDR